MSFTNYGANMDARPLVDVACRVLVCIMRGLDVQWDFARN